MRCSVHGDSGGDGEAEERMKPRAYSQTQSFDRTFYRMFYIWIRLFFFIRIVVGGLQNTKNENSSMALFFFLNTIYSEITTTACIYAYIYTYIHEYTAIYRWCVRMLDC